MKKLKYQKPQIKQKKVKLNFFLSNVYWLDQFNLTGNVYAQSGGDCGCEGAAACVNSSCACGGCDRCFAGCASAGGFSHGSNQACNSLACVSGTAIGTPGGGACATSSCASCVGGCNCNSTGGACNSGSGGGSGNSGSGSCNSGG